MFKFLVGFCLICIIFILDDISNLLRNIAYMLGIKGRKESR